MKRVLMILSTAALFTACNNEKKTDDKPAASQGEEKKMADNISYAYKADYSSDFSVGDANHSKMVLDLYKMWEDSKLDDMKSLLSDSVTIDFPDGGKFDNTVDSMVSMAKQVRSMYSSLKMSFDGWMPVHSNDMKEDYVLIWGKENTVDAKGKADSSRVHAYFLIKNNKIRSWSEFQQKLAPPPPPRPAKK